MKQEKPITYNIYEVGKLTAIVCGVYKKENAPNINSVLLKLIQADEDVKSDN